LAGLSVRLLFVGINPGFRTTAAGAHFALPSNPSCPALHAAGITRYGLELSIGMNEEDHLHLLEAEVGITNLVARATAPADELQPGELEAGVRRLPADGGYKPRWSPFVGIGAYRTAFARPEAVAGRQPQRLDNAELHVMGNPSGLKAHENGGHAGKLISQGGGNRGVVGAGVMRCPRCRLKTVAGRSDVPAGKDGGGKVD
jgi:TDG/mug DNA glycosylase family protein